MLLLLLFPLQQAYPPSDYEPVEKGIKILYLCKACCDGPPREPYNCKAYDETQIHQDAIRIFENPPPVNDNNHANSDKSIPQYPTHDLLTEDAIRALVVSLTAQPKQLPYLPGHPLVPNSQSSPEHSPATGVNWAVYETLEDTVAEQPFDVQLTQDIAQATLDFLNGNDSDFEFCEASDIQSSKSLFLI